MEYEKLNKETPCPECGIHAPKRQIENLGKCERCKMETHEVKTSNGNTVNPETNLIAKWKLNTPGVNI